MIADAFERAAAGHAAFIENSRIFIHRHGYLEETFFSFSFSPIRDETGEIAGLFHPVIEMTQATLATRRLTVLRDAADRAADARTVIEAFDMLALGLDEHALDVPFVLFYSLEPGATAAHLVAATGLTPGCAAAPRHLSAPRGSSWRRGRRPPKSPTPLRQRPPAHRSSPEG